MYKYVDTANVFPHYTHLTLDVPLVIWDAACLGWAFFFPDIMFFISGYTIAKITYLTSIFLLAFYLQGLSSSYFPNYYSRIHLTSVTFIYYYFTMAAGQVHLLTYSFKIICSFSFKLASYCLLLHTFQKLIKHVHLSTSFYVHDLGEVLLSVVCISTSHETNYFPSPYSQHERDVFSIFLHFF
jgi:hypothetical protein